MLSLFQWPDWAKEACRHAEMTDRLNKMLKPNGYFLDADVAVQDPSRSLRLRILIERAQAVLAGPAGRHGRLPERPAA